MVRKTIEHMRVNFNKLPCLKHGACFCFVCVCNSKDMKWNHVKIWLFFEERFENQTQISKGCPHVVQLCSSICRLVLLSFNLMHFTAFVFINREGGSVDFVYHIWFYTEMRSHRYYCGSIYWRIGHCLTSPTS